MDGQEQKQLLINTLIVSIGILPIWADQTKEIPNWIIYAYLGVISLIIIMLNFSFVEKWYLRLKLRKLSLIIDVLIDYQRGHLEILDRYGKKAFYNVECSFKKIKRNNSYTGEIEVEGKIDDYVDVYNCHYNINGKRDTVEIIYGGVDYKKEYSVLRNKNLFFGYGITLKDSFEKGTEYWEVHSKFYTKVYDLKISFLKTNPPKNMIITEVLIDKEGNAVKDKNGKRQEKTLKITPIITHKYNRIIAKVKLLDLVSGKTFRIYWDWDKP